MFIFLSKFLPVFVYPLGLACGLLVLVLLIHRWPRWQQAGVALALLILWIGGNRWVAMGLARSLEWRYLPQGELPQADAIVVLGGGTQSRDYPRPIVEVNGAGDRVIYGAWLYKQGKAPYVLITGGRIEWMGGDDSPAQDMANLMGLLGVPPEAIWQEPDSRNTYENAANSREILEAHGVQRILLVTSALHMPRSVALFEHQGFEVIPAPTDFSVTQTNWDQLTRGSLESSLLNLFPRADNLNMISNALKEYLGLFVYRLRGWL